MPKKPKKTPFKDLELDEQIKLVQEAMQGDIEETLTSHGGGLEIMDIVGNEVLIRYYGACGNCPIAETSTLPFIEYTLQEKVDPTIVVRSV